MNNKQIRRAMRKFTEHYGKRDTRKVIATFATAYKTTKQRISGNLSSLVGNDKTVKIIANRPNSIMF
jgi:hypothetical protein